uniref:Uncharacterized protein n=1 Tax=Haemonchus contortus TaxID=6289 RepID=A0A7I4Y4K7_HAECO
MIPWQLFIFLLIALSASDVMALPLRPEMTELRRIKRQQQMQLFANRPWWGFMGNDSSFSYNSYNWSVNQWGSSDWDGFNGFG